VRVPTDAVKQRLQVGRGLNINEVVLGMVSSNQGLVRSLFGGFGITLLRELPFAAVQFPLYEYMKVIFGHFYSG